jgi:hypothetical protein
VGVKKLSAVLCGFLGAFAAVGSSPRTAQPKPVVIFVDAGDKGFTYHIDGTPVAFSDVMSTLGRKLLAAKAPGAGRATLVLHQDVSFAQAEDLRGIAMAVGYRPRTFYFGKDRRYMIEVSYSDAVAFSPSGPPAR